MPRSSPFGSSAAGPGSPGSTSCSARAAPAASASELCSYDFEQQLLDYLRSKHGSLAAGSIAELLRDIAKTGSNQARPLLEDLARSLDSFDELHRVTPGAGSALRG